MTVLQEYYHEWALIDEAVRTHATKVRMHGLEEASHLPLNEQQNLIDTYTRRAEQFVNALLTVEEVIAISEVASYNRQEDYPINPALEKADD